MKFSVVTPLWQDRPASENLEVAINADRLGFSELWIGEMATYDAFTFATAVGNKTERISLTCGPLAVSVRTPMNMAMGIASVADLTGRQVNLALGTSSTVVVEEWHGRQRKKVARHLAETSQIVRGLLSGEKVNFKGEQEHCMGYRLRLAAPQSALTIAAFGPQAVQVAAQYSDRMVLNMVTPQSLSILRQQMEDAAERYSKPAPKLAVWLTCAVAPTSEAVNQVLRAVVGYLAAPGYSEMIAAAGFEDLVAFAKTRPHPKALLAALPDELASAIGLIGTAEQVHERIHQYQAAGADEICLVPVTAGDAGGVGTLTTMSKRYL